MKLRLAKQEDFSQMALIHTQAFQGFFLTSLGIRFLNTYYKAVLQYNTTIAVCAVDENGNILGFASGTIKALNYNRGLFCKNMFSFFFAAARAAIRNPSVFYRLAKNLDKSPEKDDDRNYAELLSIAILPQFKGSGIGKYLLEHFENEVLKRGGKKLTLTTDYYYNDRVVSFYKKCGYEVFYDFYTYPKRRMYKMIKSLNFKASL